MTNINIPNQDNSLLAKEELNLHNVGQEIPDFMKSYANKVNAIAKDFFDKYPQYPNTETLKASDYFAIDKQMDIFAELDTEGRGMWSGDKHANDICGIEKHINKYYIIRTQYLTGFNILEDFSSIEDFQKKWNAYCMKNERNNDCIKEDDSVGNMTIVAYKEYYDNVLFPEKTKKWDNELKKNVRAK